MAGGEGEGGHQSRGQHLVARNDAAVNLGSFPNDQLFYQLGLSIVILSWVVQSPSHGTHLHMHQKQHHLWESVPIRLTNSISSHVRFAWHGTTRHSRWRCSKRLLKLPHPGLRSHRKHDNSTPLPVSLQSILCALKQKTQPRVIPVLVPSSRRTSFGLAVIMSV